MAAYSCYLTEQHIRTAIRLNISVIMWNRCLEERDHLKRPNVNKQAACRPPFIPAFLRPTPLLSPRSRGPCVVPKRKQFINLNLNH